MTSTPVSLNDESLNGSWIDINSASQIHSPMDNDSPEFLRPPHSLAESVQSLGLISFQVERFLQEAQRNQGNNSNPAANNRQSTVNNDNMPSSHMPGSAALDDNSAIYSSDTDVSLDGFDTKAFITSLRRHQQQEQIGTAGNNDSSEAAMLRKSNLATSSAQRLSKSGDCLADQLSDSLSILSRTSAMGAEKAAPTFDKAASLHEFDWLWDWTAQPEYFSGQEWKVYASKQDYLMRQRQLYCSDLNKSHGGTLFSGEVISLLFLTNILSIIIGAGLTYSILMRRSN